MEQRSRTFSYCLKANTSGSSSSRKEKVEKNILKISLLLEYSNTTRVKKRGGKIIIILKIKLTLHLYKV